MVLLLVLKLFAHPVAGLVLAEVPPPQVLVDDPQLGSIKSNSRPMLLLLTACSMNEPRCRHLTPSQKAAAAVMMLPVWEEEAAARMAEARRQQGSRGQEGGRGHTKPSTQKVESRVSDRHEGKAVDP